MADDGALVIRLPGELNARLAGIAARRRQTPSELAAETLADLVRHEDEIVAGIHRGLADMKAGRVVEHEAAMDEVDAVIEAAARR